MRTRSSLLLSLSIVTALAVAAPATAQRGEDQSPQEIKDQTKSDFVVDDCGDGPGGDEIVASADKQMWPPNHKYQDFTVTALNGGAMGMEPMMTELMTSVTHDEYVDGLSPTPEGGEPEEEQGAGNTTDDARPFFAMDSGAESATTGHDVRSERSGRGDGRTYTVNAMATFDGSRTCGDEFKIEVPHDMRSSKAPAKQDKTGGGEG